MHSCFLARPFQLASLSGAASSSAPAALPCRRTPWARPGSGGANLTLRRPSRRKPHGAAESLGRRCLSFAAAAGQLSNFNRAQHVRPSSPLCLVSYSAYINMPYGFVGLKSELTKQSISLASRMNILDLGCFCSYNCALSSTLSY
jgi:hypothetical protein